MHVLPYGEIPPAEWNALAERSGEAWLFQRAEWVAVEASFFAAGQHSFGVYDDRRRLAALCPLYLREIGRTRWVERLLDSGHHRQAGPALSADLAPPERKAVFKALMRQVLDVAERVDADRVQLSTNNLAPANWADRSVEIPVWVSEYGFQLGLHTGPQCDVAVPGMATLSADQIVDLAADEDELFARLEPNFRNAVRQSQKHGLEFDPGTDPHAGPAGDRIGEYYALAEISAERTGEGLAPVAYYRAVWRALAPARCAVLFARHGGRAVAGVLVVIDKQGALYLGGVSHPDHLGMRVSNFVHWEAMRWLRRQGVARYRLGPIFPELPRDCPVSRVSWFKGRLGGESRTIIQASLFRKPERYREDALEAVERLCSPVPATALTVAPDPAGTETVNTIPLVPQRETDREGLRQVLATYGFLPAAEMFSTTGRGGDGSWSVVEHCPPGCDAAVLRVGSDRNSDLGGIDFRGEPGGRFVYADTAWSWLGRREPVYRPLLPHVSFTGPGLRPVWKTDDGRAVLAWREHGGRRELLIGLAVVEEFVRHTHGDPAQVTADVEKSRWGYGHERPNYLFEQQLVDGRRMVPWADHLGYAVAESLSRLTGLPLVETLPGGARGAVLLTGDDDEAWLEKYAEQLELVGDFPITYFLLDRTLHTPETLAKLPPNVELGLHVDALDCPTEYFARCQEQTAAVAELGGRPVRTVRNHGFLSDGYLGHLPAWEAAGIRLDVNYPGLEGTAVTGSFLPFTNRRPDGRWSANYSLLTAFGDGMVYALEWTERQALARVRQLCRQVDRSRPGVVCANFHPQNVSDVRELHRELMRWGRRRGWVALGAESLLDWWDARSQIRVAPTTDGATVHMPTAAAGLVARVPTPRGWQRVELPATAGTHTVSSPGILQRAS